MEFVQSEVDIRNFTILRRSVSDFIAGLANDFDAPGLIVLDVAPESHAGAAASFSQAVVKTLDIDPASNADYIADLCEINESVIADNSFDLIVCTEVLEHTLRPWDAVSELHRMLKPGGVLGVTSPFNFRIHGPAPDCWRFTDEGLRSLLTRYRSVSIDEIEDPQRPRMPIHYTVRALK